MCPTSGDSKWSAFASNRLMDSTVASAADADKPKLFVSVVNF